MGNTILTKSDQNKLIGIDVTQELASGNNWTATEDCWVCGSSCASNASTDSIWIDNTYVGTYCDHWTAWSFPLRKGQTLRIGHGSNNIKYYKLLI